jgi:hypothetical protein
MHLFKRLGTQDSNLLFKFLGLGDVYSRFAPEQIPDLSGVESISVGEDSVFAVSGNSFYAWGDNGSCHLGLFNCDETTEAFLTKPVVSTLPDNSQIHSISSAANHTAFLDVQGRVWVYFLVNWIINRFTLIISSH